MFHVDREKNIEICEGLSVWGYKWNIDKYDGESTFHIIRQDTKEEVMEVNTSTTDRGDRHMIMTSHDILNVTSNLLERLKKLTQNNPEVKTEEIDNVIWEANWVIGVINNSFGNN